MSSKEQQGKHVIMVVVKGFLNWPSFNKLKNHNHNKEDNKKL
jgi:hypothetical protein